MEKLPILIMGQKSWESR